MRLDASMSQLKHLALLSIIVLLITVANWQHLESSFFHSDVATLRSASSTCSAVVRSKSDPANLKPDQFISPITFKLLADAHYGSSSVPKEHLRDLRRLELKYLATCLKPGAVIFVDSNRLRVFFLHVYRSIVVPFVLVSGDTDTPVPGNISNKTLATFFESPESLIIHWFAMNCDRNLNASRFTCLMNGISQWNGQREAMRNAFNDYEGIVAQNMEPRDIPVTAVDSIREINSYAPSIDNHMALAATTKAELNNSEVDTFKMGRIVENVYKNDHLKNETFSLLVSFNIKSNIAMRQPLWNQFCDDSNRTVKSLCSFSKVDMPTFYRMISSSRFVLSPHGSGLDCYRTYEALYFGSYPVVRTSSLDEMFSDLPVLIVNSWSDVTENLLNDTFHRFHGANFNFDKLFTKYWFLKFRSFGYPSYSYDQ